jgi:hypothetical protein
MESQNAMRKENVMSPELLLTSSRLFLETMLDEINKKISDLHAEYKQDFENNAEYVDRLLLAETITLWEKQRHRVKAQLRVLDGKGINYGRLERAKLRRFKEFIEVNRNKASCPFHEDKHPSFSIRGNKGHCFSCGWHCDILNFIMQKQGLDFKQAINFLA